MKEKLSLHDFMSEVWSNKAQVNVSAEALKEQMQVLAKYRNECDRLAKQNKDLKEKVERLEYELFVLEENRPFIDLRA